jgi:hypothetical protein
MYLEKYSFKNAERIVPRHILYPIYWELEKLEHKTNIKGTSEIRNKIIDLLASQGWSNRVRVAIDTQITITSKFENVGLCLQFGNMARFYADLLKLQLMYVNETIDSAIYILPLKEYSTKLGSNIANFDRFTAELNVFQKIINVPIMVLGIEGV